LPITLAPHTSGTVQAFAEKSQGAVTLAYLPRYAPEFNPDEQVCNDAKGRLVKLFIDSKATLKISVLAILRSIRKQSDLIRSFFQMERLRGRANHSQIRHDVTPLYL
jgi:transposase